VKNRRKKPPARGGRKGRKGRKEREEREERKLDMPTAMLPEMIIR
jgi:hypothetical protein